MLKLMTLLPPPPLARLALPCSLLAVLALSLPMAAQAQATCPSGLELRESLNTLSCERLRQCTHAEVAIRIAHSQTKKGGAEMFRALERYRYCSQNRGDWTEERWMDKCTQQGWKVSRHFTADFLAEWDIPNGVDIHTTEYCVAHKKNPSRYKLYFDGNGFLYEQQHCEQDRDNDGSFEGENRRLLTGYEARVSGSPNCSPVGPNPTQIPKWVAPWD